ncbi:hypothetical protein EYF80_066623 [Liparis tanakae]|uniref:Uncharacterized protein n=1 Tax=Liparis tanakae TaxID=230148 RepID=A0A4Z2E3C3_9TELE|nr:hypothetical protein EYF80_066623 [Liparis tanakae]
MEEDLWSLTCSTLELEGETPSGRQPGGAPLPWEPVGDAHLGDLGGGLRFVDVAQHMGPVLEVDTHLRDRHKSSWPLLGRKAGDRGKGHEQDGPPGAGLRPAGRPLEAEPPYLMLSLMEFPLSVSSFSSLSSAFFLVDSAQAESRGGGTTAPSGTVSGTPCTSLNNNNNNKQVSTLKVLWTKVRAIFRASTRSWGQCSAMNWSRSMRISPL